MERPKSIEALAWETYRRAFKDGDQVVIETDEGKFVWGVLKTKNDGIMLGRPKGRRASEFLWEEIVFMAHDGFPDRGIIGMTKEEAEDRAFMTDTELIRSFLVGASSPKHKIPPPSTSTYVPSERKRSFGLGCPFAVEGVYIRSVLNIGNNGPQYWGWDNEETLILESRDGAIMHSFDMSHIFLFDGLQLTP